MKNFDEIYEIHKTIKSNFLALEQETVAILSCDADDIEGHTLARVEYLEMNKKLYEEIFDFCKTYEKGEALEGAVKNTAMRDELPEEIQEIFDRFSQVYAIINRVVNVDKQVTERIEREQNKIIKQIKEMNTGHESKAAKFYAASDTGEQKHLGDSKRRI
ncbi:MAG: hypothetical protein E7509_01705 [Ruminococcus sp.]|nr:hypothetical protein [Ruminococcus sp.]